MTKYRKRTQLEAGLGTVADLELFVVTAPSSEAKDAEKEEEEGERAPVPSHRDRGSPGTAARCTR